MQIEGAIVDCHFEWGEGEVFTASAPCIDGTASAGYLPVSAIATGLSPGHLYHWRLVAGNEAGTGYGEVEVFETDLQEPVKPSTHKTSSPPKRKRHHANPLDKGLYVASCPSSAASARVPLARLAIASHAGWPPEECLKMDKGTYGRSHTLVGARNAHNWLLGGYGNDTIWAGNKGDVLWGDYQPSGQSESEHDIIHGGAGADWIYSSHGHNEIWTGAGNDHLALVYGYGTIHCNGAGLKTLVMRALPQNRHWALLGCSHIKIQPYKA